MISPELDYKNKYTNYLLGKRKRKPKIPTSLQGDYNKFFLDKCHITCAQNAEGIKIHDEYKRKYKENKENTR